MNYEYIILIKHSFRNFLELKHKILIPIMVTIMKWNKKNVFKYVNNAKNKYYKVLYSFYLLRNLYNIIFYKDPVEMENSFKS